MKSLNVDVFFSCSFQPKDKNVNDYFYSICKSLDIRGVNVSTAFTKTPPEKAKQLIGDSQFLLAVCTKRKKGTDDKYHMPESVQDELSIAYGLDIPVLMFVEKDVYLEGFKSNYGTYLTFDRKELYNPEFLEKVVTAIHCEKLEGATTNEILETTNEFFAEYCRQLIQMKEAGSGFTWTHSISRKLVFLKPFKKSIPTSVWAENQSKKPSSTNPIDWQLSQKSSSRSLQISETIENHTPDRIDVLLKINPHPENGDFVEYSTIASSPFLNPVWDEDAVDSSSIHLSDGAYKCCDGFVPIHRVKNLTIEFRFPRSYGLEESDIRTFVGSYTSNIDFEVESELERTNKKIESFAGDLSVRMEIESPLLRHMYGIAWNPKPKPPSMLKVKPGVKPGAKPKVKR
jgi:hypothetical protein